MIKTSPEVTALLLLAAVVFNLIALPYVFLSPPSVKRKRFVALSWLSLPPKHTGRVLDVQFTCSSYRLVYFGRRNHDFQQCKTVHLPAVRRTCYDASSGQTVASQRKVLLVWFSN